MKKQKGITLIALIITIIVMLILVGVTVTTAINGCLFEKARIGAKGTQKEVDREKLNMAVAFAYDETTGKIDKTKLEQELGDEWTVTESESESGTYLCENTKTGNKFKVKANGKITDDEPLTINCKIVESTTEDKGEITTSKIMLFIPETGIDYEENFCKLNESDSIEAGWEAIWRSSEEGDKSEFSMAKVEQMINESNGLEGENTLSIDEWTKWYALVYEAEVKKSVSIKFNGTELIRETGDTPQKELEGDEANMQLSEMTIKVKVGEKVWSNKPLGEEFIKTIKPGDIFLQKDESDSKKDTYYTVLYNDDSHGLQLIANKTYDYNPYPFYFSEYAFELLTYMNNAAAEEVNISKYAEKTRNVGGPFIDTAEDKSDNWPADSYYLEDCEQMEKLGILKIEKQPNDTSPTFSGYSYTLSSRIVIPDGDSTIYGLRKVSAAGEYGDNIYEEIKGRNTTTPISVNLSLRPVVKISSNYYDSILLKSTDGNGVKTYIFSE